jgi:hypothetical protein
MEKADSPETTDFIDDFQRNPEKRLVRATGVEPITFGFGDRRSIQLSYARKLLKKLFFRQNIGVVLIIETQNRNMAKTSQLSAIGVFQKVAQNLYQLEATLYI